MARELPDGQIRPVAQPLSSFLEPARRQVAAPAGQLEIPRAPEIRVIQQNGPGDVRGANQFEQMAQALAPFNQALTQLASVGMQSYASAEVVRGRNEALRAKALLDEQQRQSAVEFADETRKLAQADPIGALMMDAVNPFRRGGRLRALTDLAALEAKSTVVDTYRGTEGTQLWKEGDPRLKALEVEAINTLRSKFKIDENSPGFERVLAQINEGSDRITDLHWRERQDYLKGTVPVTASAEILGFYFTSLTDQSIQIYSQDGRAETITSSDPRWDAARSQRITLLLDRLTEELGLPGERMAAKQKALDELLAVANSREDKELLRLLQNSSILPADKNGFRPPVWMSSPTANYDSEIKYGELAYKRKQREKEELGSQYQDAVIQQTYQLPDGPERLEAIEKLRNDPRFQGLPLNDKLELEQKGSTSVDAVRTLGRSVEGVSALLLDMGGRYGNAWNPGQADAEFEQALAGAPDDKKPELRRQYADLRDRNNRREAAPTTREANAVIDGKIRAMLRANYPSTTTEAALRNGNIEAVLAGLSDANAKESARRQYSAYQGYVRSKIAAEEAKKGRPLTTPETMAIATQAVDEYGKSDPKQRAYLFPGVDGQPGIQGLTATPAPGAAPAGGGASTPKPPPGTKPFTGRVYPSGQLDNMPDRAERVVNWRNQPVLDANSIVQEANRIISGGTPSAALRRFAKDAGITPGQLLNKQIDFYPNTIQITPAERQKLQRDGRQAQATRAAAQGIAAADPGPVGYAQRAIGNLLAQGFTSFMGGPAAAATMPPSTGAGQGGGQVALRSPAPSVSALSSPSLSRLGTGPLVPTRPGLCVTAVLKSMAASGLPNPAATGGDAGNNPRGLASQLVRSHGWKPLPGLGRPRTINSPYGSFTANQMTASEYVAAARAGRIPSGAVVFQTRRDWNGTSPRSSGFDAAIARNGGMNLWNGSMAGPTIYGSATTQVFVLVPGDSIRGGNTARR